MNSEVFITKASKFLPNTPVENAEMEEYLGMIGGKPSKAKNIVLRQNGIKKRYYALTKDGKYTHTNAELTVKTIQNNIPQHLTINDIEMLCCGTSMADQLMPSHSAMVHGLLKNAPMEILSAAGICCAGMHALKYGFLSVASGNTKNAICTGSEASSPSLQAKGYEKEFEENSKVEANPYIAFEKDFLRWMLSDGAGSVLLENKATGETSLKIEWIETISYANELDTCMYSGASQTNGSMLGWRQMSPEQWSNDSTFSVKQDVKLLSENVIKKAVEHITSSVNKHNIVINDVDYFLPHISSMFFCEKLRDAMDETGLHIDSEKWFLNLPKVGNVGSASIYLMIEELLNSGKLKKGQKIFLFVPESGRFSYATSLLTVV